MVATLYSHLVCLEAFYRPLLEQGILLFSGQAIPPRKTSPGSLPTKMSLSNQHNLLELCRFTKLWFLYFVGKVDLEERHTILFGANQSTYLEFDSVATYNCVVVDSSKCFMEEKTKK